MGEAKRWDTRKADFLERMRGAAPYIRNGKVVAVWSCLRSQGVCGAPGLLWSRAAAQSFLDEGGVYRENWREHALAIHQEMIARNLSPGGSADLLAATLFVHRLQGSLKSPK